MADPAHFMAIDSGVTPYQVVQRGEDDTADLCVGGRTTAPDGTTVEARLLEFGQPVPAFTWQCVGRVEGGCFSATLASVPTGGEYTLQLRTLDDGGECLCSADVHGMLVGDLWMLGGQSNMQGIGRLASKHIEPPTPLAHSFDMADRWVTAKEPLHWRIQSVDPAHHPVDVEISEKAVLQDHKGRLAGVGTGLRFARRMIEETGVPVGLVPCAVGGTSMDQWDPAKKEMGGESLYGAMIRRFHAVGGRVKGLLWYQGESDTGEGLPAGFERKFRRFLKAVRHDTGQPDLPVLCVQIGRFVTEPFRPGWNMVQEAQRKVAAETADVEIVPAVDLELDDGIHLSAAGHRRLGARLAWAALHTVFDRADVQPGPRPASVVAESPTLIRVKYECVNGSLVSPGEVTGFTLRASTGQTIPIIYRADVDADDPTSVLLHLDKPLPSRAVLYYGYGMHPWCNLTDERDMGALVFGPIAPRSD